MLSIFVALLFLLGFIAVGKLFLFAFELMLGYNRKFTYIQQADSSTYWHWFYYEWDMRINGLLWREHGVIIFGFVFSWEYIETE